MNNLSEYREIINQIDQKFVPLFEERMSAVRMIAKLKEENDLPVKNQKREEELLLFWKELHVRR